jgi:hypothetical protein
MEDVSKKERDRQKILINDSAGETRVSFSSEQALQVLKPSGKKEQI